MGSKNLNVNFHLGYVGLKNTDWFIIGTNQYIKFISSTDLTTFKSFTTSGTVEFVDGFDHLHHIACMHGFNELSIYDWTLSDNNSNYIRQFVISNIPDRFKVLSDEKKVAISFIDTIKMYNILDNLGNFNSYQMDTIIYGLASPKGTSLIAAIEISSLKLLDWSIFSNPNLQWSKDFAIETNSLGVLNGSESLFVIGDYHSLNPVGFRIYDRSLNQIIQSENINS